MTALILATVLALACPSLAQIDPICASVAWEEIVLLPIPGDCTRYYECDHGVRTIHDCDPGLWFSNRLQACDHPDVSECYPLVCPPGIVAYYPNIYACTEYYECYRGELNLRTCPAGLWFSNYEKRCVSPQLSQCGQYATTVEPTWTTPTATCYGVLPGQIVLKPYPGDCNRFIECIGSSERTGSCPPNLFFNADRQMCDIPSISGCTETVTPAPPDYFDDPRCANGNTDYWPDLDCTKFIECYEYHGYALDCPSGLYFDSLSKICLDPSLSDCGRSPSPTPATRPPNWTPDPFCPWLDYNRYLFAYPGDCTKFLVCYYGERTVEDCPSGLWFNPILEVCDYPYHAGCIWARLDDEI